PADLPRRRGTRGRAAGAAAERGAAVAEPGAAPGGARVAGGPRRPGRPHAPPDADRRAAPDRERVTTGPFDIDGAIRRVPAHAHAGILFYDLLPLFQEAAGLSATVARIAAWGRERAVDRVVGVEARGFVLGGAIATELGVGFSAARKPGKLPSARVSREYA